MSYRKVAELMQLLATRTEVEPISWTETEKEGAFQAALPKYAVRLSIVDSWEGDDVNDMLLQIYNEHGDVVESVRDTDLKEFIKQPYTLMKSTYDQARRQALGVEAAIDEILAELRGTARPQSGS